MLFAGCVWATDEMTLLMSHKKTLIHIVDNERDPQISKEVSDDNESCQPDCMKISACHVDFKFSDC